MTESKKHQGAKTNLLKTDKKTGTQAGKTRNADKTGMGRSWATLRQNRHGGRQVRWARYTAELTKNEGTTYIQTGTNHRDKTQLG